MCARVIDAGPPRRDYPTPAQATALKGCDGEALLYGIGRPADPGKARHCALLQRQAPRGEFLDYFAGAGILSVIYANGRGVPKNLDIATHMACGVSDAPAATDGRVQHLASLRTKAEAAAFGICDDATSGAAGGNCAYHEAKLAEQARNRRIAALSRGWSATQRALFLKAYRSMTAYADLFHELDCYGGTLAAGCQIGGREQDVENFLSRIEALRRGDRLRPARPPTHSQEDTPPDPAEEAAAWRKALAEMPANDRRVYEANERKTDAARKTLEADLIAFTRLAFPKMAPRQLISQILGDS
jgi:hypothetical protein